MNRRILIISGVLGVLAAGWFLLKPGEEIDFSTQVKPILNKHCISCHGGVKQNAGFSLLFEEEALGKTESGRPAIIPGKASRSEFIRRIKSEDPDERMPYEAPPLSKEEIRILTKWVNQGAEWGEHWAYSLPEQVEVPGRESTLSAGFSGSGEGESGSWAKNNIDHFILQKLQEQELLPSPGADKATLLRRLYLDLTGLPPAPEQVEAFLQDKSAGAYERVVDSLLASPRYGERWASWWLDMARYADTKGYEKDVSREIWPYRDWVIRAFNEDKPFDEFTIEQLAGDLLPEPTKDQLIATAFHRNTMSNDEGGTEDEEFRVASVIDRVNTTWQVWQSTTFECVQCHSHPYDPFRHEDYYKFMAFFNNTRDEDTEGDHPKLRLYDEKEKESLREIKAWIARYGNREAEESAGLFLKTIEPKIHAHDCDRFENGALVDTKWLGIRHGGSCRLPGIPLEGRSRFYLRYWTSDPGGELEIRLDSLGGATLAKFRLPVTKGREIMEVPFEPVPGTHDLYLVFRNPSLKPGQQVCMVEWLAFREALPGQGEDGYREIQDTFLGLLNETPSSSVPVMLENPPGMRRTTHVFERGNWLVKGDEVQPDVPGVLPDLPAGAPRNRLGLARWLVSEENPLTARTVVNRFWEQLFGRGLAETLEDLGSQGEDPTHPALLDYLALRFMHEMNWSMKQLLKEMVMSATYRQSSKATEELLEKDPVNRFYARGPRFRLSAEQVRDQALAVSGLLSDKMYGPSVMPYQPEGVWMSVYNNEKWEQSKGEDQYRRAVYTFLKRTSIYPSFVTFDAGSREVCLIQRIRTNTPLQALTTLNDPVYQEAARHLAIRMEKAGGDDSDAAIRAGYRRALQKEITTGKLASLQRLYQRAYRKYSAEPEEAKKLLQEEDAGPGGARQAALTIVAGAILNLDEFLTKS